MDGKSTHAQKMGGGVPCAQSGSVGPVLIAITFGVFLTAFLSSALTIAIPEIEREFSLSALSASWVATAYLLCSGAFTLLSGWLGDRYGRSQMYLLGLGITSSTTVLSAIAPLGEVLIALRALQGVGAALVFANSIALVSETQPDGARGRALGFTVMATYLGLSSGPALAGLLVESYGWRSIFIIPALSGILAIIATLRIRQTRKKEKTIKDPLDRLGALLSIIAPACFVLGVSFLQIEILGISLLACGVFFAVCFILHGRKLHVRGHSPAPSDSRRDPAYAGHAPAPQTVPAPRAQPVKAILDVNLFSENRVFSFSCLAAFLNYSATYAIAFLLSIWLQFARGFSPLEAGLVLITQPAIQAILSPIFGALSDRVDRRIMASSGMVIGALAVLWFALEGASSLPAILFGLGLAGMGHALFASPNSNAIMSAVTPAHYGFASAAIALSRTSGQLFSMCLVGAVFALYYGKAQLSQLDTSDLSRGVEMVFLLMFFFIVPGIWFSLARNKNKKCEGTKEAR
jgi:MFS family permease